jgi:hypothetical protein
VLRALCRRGFFGLVQKRKIKMKGVKMQSKRREFLKKALVGSAAVATASAALANERPSKVQGSNGVVVGHSPKKEILYKKTAHWREYYSVAS